ncbi:MAG: hypothetical protein D4R66_06300, partial [Opitutales bacterium]
MKSGAGTAGEDDAFHVFFGVEICLAEAKCLSFSWRGRMNLTLEIRRWRQARQVNEWLRANVQAAADQAASDAVGEIVRKLKRSAALY